MMNIFFKLYIQEPINISDENMFLKTLINYKYNNINLFTSDNKINKYCPFQQIEIKDINFYYISVYNKLESEKNFDSDFNLGFNNLDIRYEIDLIYNFIKKNNLLFLLISPFMYRDIDLKNIPLFNKNSEKYIMKNFNVVNLSKNKLIYLVQIKNKNELKQLNDYIYCFILNPELPDKSFSLPEKKNIFSINNLNILVNLFDLIIIKSPIYGNYNLAFYSKYIKKEIIVNKLNQFSIYNNIQYKLDK